MKYTINHIIHKGIAAVGFLALLLLPAACSDFTDIQPKGKNLLKSTNDLELLLNNEMELEMTDFLEVGGSVLYAYSSVPAAISVDNPSRSAYLMGWKDSEQDIKRFQLLTTSDSYYTDCYSYIGTIANPILQQLPSASGSETVKNELKAEALALRAYFHFMVLQKYAKAYNPATADKDPGVAYMTEDVDISTLQPKKTVKEAYTLALKDIDDAIALNALPVKNASTMRMNKAAAYAIKAHIFMAMRDYIQAEEAAKAALETQGDLYDYWSHATTQQSYGGVSYQSATADCRYNPESYFILPNLIIYSWVQPDTWNSIEDGYAMRDLMPTMGKVYKGYAGGALDDYGATFGLPGWQSGWDVTNYSNGSGLCSPMMYLYLAECEIRNGNIDKGMEYLDILRAKRLPSDGFKAWKGVVTDKATAIAKLKQTSLAENLWNGWNFIQRKRWNTEDDWKETLTRTIGTTAYTLAPTSNLWVLPIPSSVSEKNSNLTPNTNE